MISLETGRIKEIKVSQDANVSQKSTLPTIYFYGDKDYNALRVEIVSFKDIKNTFANEKAKVLKKIN